MFVLCGDLKNLPVLSFNALIIPIFRDCLPNYFLVVLNEICDLIGSVSKGFPTYSFTEAYVQSLRGDCDPDL